jgi:hypothetical protein
MFGVIVADIAVIVLVVIVDYVVAFSMTGLHIMNEL